MMLSKDEPSSSPKAPSAIKITATVPSASSSKRISTFLMKVETFLFKTFPKPVNSTTTVRETVTFHPFFLQNFYFQIVIVKTSATQKPIFMEWFFMKTLMRSESLKYGVTLYLHYTFRKKFSCHQILKPTLLRNPPRPLLSSASRILLVSLISCASCSLSIM